MFTSHFKKFVNQRTFRRASLLVGCLLLLWQPVVSAIPEKLDAIVRGTPYYNPDAVDCSIGAGAPINGNDNIAQIYNYLVGKGLTDFQAAGILGNIHSESGYNPRRVQGTPTPSGDADTPPPGSIGYGIVQWTPGTKILPYAQETNRQPSDLLFQLDFLWKQLQNEEKPAYDAVVASTDVATSTLAFETKFERHAGPPQPDRVVEAERILDMVRSGGLQSGGGGSGKPVIALDPGHSGTTIKQTDPQTGLTDYDYPNDAEMSDVFEVAQQVKTKLETDGYSVVMTKNNVDDTVSLRQRSDIASQSGAALAVSIHDQPDKPFGSFEQIYAQNVGDYRTKSDGTKVEFMDATLADKSNQYASIFKEQRSQIEGASAVITHTSFDNRDGFSGGNIPLVQLWSTVPWVYNEAGGGTIRPDGSRTGLTVSEKGTYASALIASIEKAVPASGSSGTSGCNRSNAGLSATVLSYAWPEYHPAPYVTKKAEYETAIQNAITNGQYVGGLSLPGVDCGGFVTRLMIDSGFEPGYNYAGSLANGAGPVANQKAWLDANWQRIGQVSSTSELQPGDVAIFEDLSHTYVYVGQVPGFGSSTASASLGDGNGSGRAPMAGRDDVTASNIIWYRKR